MDDKLKDVRFIYDNGDTHDIIDVDSEQMKLIVTAFYQDVVYHYLNGSFCYFIKLKKVRTMRIRNSDERG